MGGEIIFAGRRWQRWFCYDLVGEVILYFVPSDGGMDSGCLTPQKKTGSPAPQNTILALPHPVKIVKTGGTGRAKMTEELLNKYSFDQCIDLDDLTTSNE